MFQVPLHRLVISRAGDRTLASKNCAINSSIYPMLLCTHRVDITCLQWGIRWNILTTCGGYTAREWLLQAFTVQQWGPSKLWGRSTLSACWGEAAKVAGMLAPQSANTKRGKGRGILFWYLLALIKTFKFDISSFAAQRPRAQWLIWNTAPED